MPADIPSQVKVDPTYGCWKYAGALNSKGYGPHRQFWQAHYRAKIPDGMVLDHICRNHCVTPWHLEVVTPSENELRKSKRNRDKITHCPEGHKLVDRLAVIETGGYVCRICLRLQLTS